MSSVEQNQTKQNKTEVIVLYYYYCYSATAIYIDSEFSEFSEFWDKRLSKMSCQNVSIILYYSGL